MRPLLVSISGTMIVVAAIAVDCAVVSALGKVPNLGTRIGLFGILPPANLLAVCLATVVSGLVGRGEVALARVTFLLFGGTAILLVLVIVNLAPDFFYAYISNTVGLYVRPGQNMPAVFRFWMVGSGLIETLLACGAITPLVLVPALLAGWTTRGYRLKLLRGPEAAGD